MPWIPNSKNELLGDYAITYYLRVRHPDDKKSKVQFLTPILLVQIKANSGCQKQEYRVVYGRDHA